MKINESKNVGKYENIKNNENMNQLPQTCHAARAPPPLVLEFVKNEPTSRFFFIVDINPFLLKPISSDLTCLI
jgi:hypothetical protein